MLNKKAAAQKEIQRLKTHGAAPTQKVNDFLREHNSTEITSGVQFAELLRRPELSYEALAEIDPDRPQLDFETAEQVEINVKYEGDITRQIRQVEEMRRVEERLLPDDIDYDAIPGLRLEARDKLKKLRPRSVGQASRICGVSPADVTVLLIWMKK